MNETELVNEGAELVDGAHAGALIADAIGAVSLQVAAVCVDDEEPRPVEAESLESEVSDEG